ncbi:DHA1 family bicyclomycin/chloramphenicol resistance-like MFS transporter [Dyadobacter sp. BE34]|uniref:DHA1 family bicyclomycin/chloramphenicol resistance-like MFS transporter n=1 Tax=Dyadobacter fermentans TaxID=94254 RepID=A0ABU1R4D9_9BACT|nr:MULTISPECIES: multidrug effflux MFS transporter [Dyadobacter]MDR6808258.1 DHA1 family bicyclomycin/chloramphenicol resistance-like MFS transporter [Dyadobacter fermentans]MDR7045926.1 DHA1 family bicyclomycin/chloramphenicol resistance-like MFS transporter [Dyadobacter sp. BE242]MDR7200239.1 DHA1 family bicyclomycin/chloramphenicol resistance-like MFS transporter [Dyadobacter sp. BE34]MDR7218199.1 DHA1 family bicyclomycin/chloramphenicol resistance-like MFS transporter [Dyadobacter sp. BE31]
MSKKTYFFLILILGSLTALGPFSIDMYLPGFPAIARDLNTTAAKVSQTLSGYFVGISLGQLLYGPLLDRFGRKKPLFIGLAVYILASAGCAVATSVEQLIILRIIQAVGSCAATVASVAMVRDLFPVNENAKVFSLLLLVVGFSPMIAPTVGGYVTDAFGWHAVFMILTVMGVAIFAATALWLPDSYKPDKTLSLKPRPIIMNFLEVLREPQFYTYSVTGAVAFAGLFAYVSGSPIVFMEVFHVDGKVYGWIFAFLSVGFIGSGQVNTLMLRRFSSEQIVNVALICQAVIGLAFLAAALNGALTLTSTLVFLFLFLCCVGYTYPNAAALSLAPFTRNAGSASALMGAFQMGAGTLISIAISLFEEPSIIPMVAAMAGSATLALIMLVVGRRFITNKVEVQQGAGAGVMH